MATPAPSTLYRLCDQLLDGELADFLIEQRQLGDSFEIIAKRLWVRTDEQINVTKQTVSAWWDWVLATSVAEKDGSAA